MRARGLAVAVVLAALVFTLQSSRVVPAQGCPTFFDGTCFNVASAGDSVAAPSVVPLTIRQGPVNNPAADTTARNVQHTPALVDLGGGKLVAAFYDLGSYNGTNRHLDGYAYSSNNGVTWTDAGTLPSSTEGDGGLPAMAADKTTGAVYLAMLGFQTLKQIPVFKSTNSGHTFHAPVNGSPGGGGTGNFNPRIAVDNFTGSGRGNVYLCWQGFTNTGNPEIRLTRSLNAGATFVPNLGNLVAAGGLGCFLTVSPNHQVSVFYIRGTGPQNRGGDNKLFMRRSLNQGQTFQAEAVVADLKTTSTDGSLQLRGGIYTTSYPQAAVNPVNARPYLYVVYNDDLTPAHQTDDNGDTFLVRSTNNGVTWSAPLRLNDDLTRDQFAPNIAFVDAGERLMISYFSRSHDPENFRFHRRARLATLNAAGAAVFSPSFQLGPDTSPRPYFGASRLNYIGEYEAIASGSGAISVLWPDSRGLDSSGSDRQPDIYFARIAAPPTKAGLSLNLSAAPTTIKLGSSTIITVTAKATGGTASDVFVHLNPPFGLAIQTVTPPAGGFCTLIEQFVDCSLGTIAVGASKSIKIVAVGVYAAAKRTAGAIATTSSPPVAIAAASEYAEPHAGQSGSIDIGVVPATTVTKTYSSGNITALIPSQGLVRVPIKVADEGTSIAIVAVVRSSFTQDGELSIALGGPVKHDDMLLSHHEGGFGRDFGTGTDDCDGSPTVFSDFADTPIRDGVAPFDGGFRPSSGKMLLLGKSIKGDWLFSFFNIFSAFAHGNVGCVQLTITYVK